MAENYDRRPAMKSQELISKKFILTDMLKEG